MKGPGTNRRWLAALVLCFAQAGQALAKTPVRVAIVPPEYVGAYTEGKQYCEAVADDLQDKLRDTPGVEWVERADLDRLLAEVRPALDSGVGVSPMVLGRLLKADVILTGRLEGSAWRKRGDREEYTSGLELQVIDLTNASVLAREQWDFANEVAGVAFGFSLVEMDPQEFANILPDARSGGSEPNLALQRLQAMTRAQVIAEVHKSVAMELDKTAAVGRKLLIAGLAERRATAAATQLVPIFFADAGTGPNIGDWEEKWRAALREEAGARPGVRLLQFLGIEQARQEQKLALLGLTQAEPAAWQSTADGYIWGNYQVIPGTQTTEAGETEVEAEVFLRLGGAEPQRFSRRCKVRDFPDAVRALAREVLEAAQGQHPRRSSEANARIARMIFERLCTLVNGGFFQADPPLAGTLPTTSANVVGTYGEVVLDPIKRLPHTPEKLAYCRQMLDLACFFDPNDNRLQMLRWMLANTRFGPGTNPDRQLEPMAECIGLLERIAHARDGFDAVAFAVGVEAVMNYLIMWQQGPGWTVPAGQWSTKTVLPAQIPAQREALLGIFFPAVEEALPVLSQRLDEAKIPLKGRRFLAQWLALVLEGNLKPEIRMQYLLAAWPYTPTTERDLTQYYLKLMDDLGDRKRVQSVLMQPKRMDVPPAAPPGDAPPALQARSRPPAGNNPPNEGDEPLLAGWKPAEAPPVRTVLLPLDRFGSGPGPVARTSEEMLGEAAEPGNEASIRQIDGCGDQLVLGLRVRLRGMPGNVHLLFQTSSEAMRVLDATGLGVARGDGFRVLYHLGGAIGWTDLLSAERGVFSPENGSPITSPAVFGFDGSGRAVVGGDGAKAAALFDWDKRRWLLLPTPPAVLPAPAPADSRYFPPVPALAFGAGEAIVFPSWNLVFDQAKQKWRDLPAGACLPARSPTANADPRGLFDAVAGGQFCVDGHLWSWNEQGITDFLVDENRVVWHADTRHLGAVCQDGPYLWLTLRRPGSPENGSLPGRSGSTLVLLDRRQHAVLGAVDLHRAMLALHADEHQLWMGPAWEGPAFGRGTGRLALFCVDKARLYAALPGTTSPAARARTSPLINGEPALYAAILDQDAEAVGRLLDGGASASAVFGDSKTPALMVAAWTGNEALCRLLIRRGAAVDALLPTDRKAWTALATAARQDNPVLLKLLLDFGAKPTEAALTEALRNANFEAAALLIKAGAPLWNLVPTLDAQPNDELARRILDLHPALPPAEQARLAVLARVNDDLIPGLGDDPKKAADLIERAAMDRQWERAAAIIGQLPAACLRRPEMRRAFLWVIRGGCLPAVNAFLDAGVSLAPEETERYPGGYMRNAPLEEALRQPEVFRLFLRRGADPHLLDWQEDTFAERAAGSAKAASTLPLLLGQYPPLAVRFGYGTFGGALLCAAAAGWPHAQTQFTRQTEERPVTTAQTLQMLLDAGVPPDAPGREGYTALHAAFAVRSASVACFLAGAGADLQTRDLAGLTIFDAPYCLVGQGGFVEKLQAYLPRSDLEKRGKERLLAALAARDHYPDLYQAVSDKNIARVRELLQQGSTVTPPYALYRPDNDYSHRPGLVFLAVKNGDCEMVRLLLDRGCDPNIGEAGCSFYAQTASPLSQTAQPYSAGQRPEALPKCPTPLIVAAEAGDPALVDLLLDHGAYAPAMDQFLRNAADAASTPELAAHIARRARLQFEAEKLLPALGFGAPAGNDQIIRKISAEAPEAFLIPNAQGLSPLSRAVSMVGLSPRWDESVGRPVMYSDGLKQLAQIHQNGIPLNCLDFYGTTPLHRAVLYAQAQNVAELVKTGFDPRFPDRRGITATDLAGGILDPKQREEVLAALQSGTR